jgi:hypothetical protein
MSWRSFEFFSQELVADPEVSTAADASSSSSYFPTLFKSIDMVASSHGRGQLVFADALGFVHIVDRGWNTSSFPAYDRAVTHLHQMKQRNILLTIGIDEEIPCPLLKVWNLDKSDRNKNPVCLRVIKIQYGGEVNSVSALAVADDLSHTAVGLSNGIIVLIKGDLSCDRFTRQRVLHEENRNQGPVTGLAFRDISLDGAVYNSAVLGMPLATQYCQFLFVTTDHTTSGYLLSPQRDFKEFTDDQGCRLGCSSLDWNRDFVIVRPEGIYVYSVEGRGPCYSLETERAEIGWFRTYLIVMNSVKPARTSPSLPSLKGVAAASSDTKTDLVAYDLKSKLIAYTSSLGNVIAFIHEWGSIFLLTSDKKVTCLSCLNSRYLILL